MIGQYLLYINEIAMVSILQKKLELKQGRRKNSVGQWAATVFNSLNSAASEQGSIADRKQSSETHHGPCIYNWWWWISMTCMVEFVDMYICGIRKRSNDDGSVVVGPDSLGPDLKTKTWVPRSTTSNHLHASVCVCARARALCISSPCWQHARPFCLYSPFSLYHLQDPNSSCDCIDR